MRALRKILATTVAGLALAVGAQAPAQAAWSNCNAANFCIFDGTSGTGLMYQWTVGYILTQPNDCVVLTGSQNNMASSVYFNGSFAGGNYIVLFASGTSGASAYVTANGYQDANLNSSPGIVWFNNTVSTICVRS